ncbi:fused MFS/spermidine synthase [Cardiobacterium valvarum]|uniref:Spermine/spermidine synthase n=1 Tax=Cardiobacterium valvarum F0432 TaxID=797473 RepID=G9ZBW0_9GAMM|nr:fused MFS/spermidine synthase [Cardiobacterium valvarum]EHM55988.1 Spermine/spermidine synthase [Cardiobacterium valvarum F0432]
MQNPSTPTKPAASGRALLLGIFILSGFAGLIYQSIWSHYLGIFLGHAAYAQALVLAIFMGGMAAGAMWIARAGERWRNLIRCYALIEGLIGVLGLLFHWIFTAVLGFSYDVLMPAAGSPFMADMLRWLTAAVLILPQTILLGMTFPLMSGGLIRRFPGQDGSLLGGLYFTNSIGAACGALLSAFVLLPAFGLPGTVMTAGVLNLVVATLALYLARTPEPPAHLTPKDCTEAPVLRPLLRAVLLSTTLSGAASFVYEIVWIRMLSMAVGSTLHAFELMLTSFIAGIAFGGLWVRKRADSSRDPLRLAGWMQVGMGLAALFSLIVYSHAFDWVGWLMGGLEKTANGYTLYSFGTAVIAICIMLPAAFFAGTTLPLFTVTLLRKGHGERVIGQVYAWNTIGSIAGVFAAMHLMIPILGLKLALVLAAFIDMAIGLFLLRREADSKPHLLRTAAATATVVLATILSITQVQFDPLKLAGGVFRTGNVTASGQVLFYRDGKTASVSVRQVDTQRAIATNGKPDAGIAMQGEPAPDEATMTLLAALPLVMHDNPEEIGVIGFGSGMSTHTLLGDMRVKRIDTIEIEPAMVEGAKLFGKHVERAYNDPRSHIIIDDAKSYFSGRQAKYDIIVSEPSNPWISGIGALFSREFYEFVPRHLKPNGLFVQWVQLYEIDDALVASIINALTPAFADYRAYITNTADLVIIATPQGTLPELRAERVLHGLIGDDMKHQGIESVAQLQLRQIADGRLLRAYGALFDTRANSYYYPRLSLNAPQTRFTGSMASYLINLNTPVSTTGLLPEALGIRQALPAATVASALRLFQGEMDTYDARLYAELLRTGHLTTPAERQLDSSWKSSAYLLRQTAEQVCKRADDRMAVETLARNLRSTVDLTLMVLPPELHQGVLIDPAWLPCAPETVSVDFAHIQRLNAALAARDWRGAHALGEAWLTKTDAAPVWKAQFDDIALAAVLLDHARNGDWQDLQTAEKRLSPAMTTRNDYSYRLISLLLAMADSEQAVARQAIK